MTERQLNRLLDYLFTSGNGERADRLVLTTKEGKDLGGWCRLAVRYAIKQHLPKAGRPKGKAKA